MISDAFASCLSLRRAPIIKHEKEPRKEGIKGRIKGMVPEEIVAVVFIAVDGI